LIPLTYALAMIGFTRDLWSAMAGFIWWGIITAGFLVYGRNWWKGLALAAAFVVLIFVVSPQPQMTFGIVFLLVFALGIGFKINCQREEGIQSKSTCIIYPYRNNARKDYFG